MKRLLLDGPELRRDIPPAPVTRAEPVVRLRSGLTLDDRSCWQYPTMLVGSVGSGKSTLLDQIQQPVLAHAAKAGDAVVIFAAKPDVLRYRRPGDPVISVSASDPGSRWDIFAELNHAANPMLMLREISSSLFAEQRKQNTQVFFPDAAQELFYQSARFMFEVGQKKKIHISNAELIDFLTHTPINGKDGWIDLADRYPAYFACVRDFIGDGSTQGQGVLSELRTMISKVFICCLKTYPACFLITADGRLRRSSIRWTDWGMAWNGRCSTAKISASLSPAAGCILSDILMSDVEEKYYLSPTQQEMLLHKSDEGPRASESIPPKG